LANDGVDVLEHIHPVAHFGVESSACRGVVQVVQLTDASMSAAPRALPADDRDDIIPT